MTYIDTCNLPFNRGALNGEFIISPAMVDDGEAGFWLVLQGNALVVRDPDHGGALPEGDLPLCLAVKSEPLIIGRWFGKPVRVAFLGRDTPLQPPWVAEPLAAAEQRLNDQIMTLGGIAQQILHWQRQSIFCPRCGTRNLHLPVSWGKRCPTCAIEHFPHIHPCAIVLVTRGDEFLLTRKAGWIPGRFSLVAGFVDMGESLEECVHREVLEETGITVGSVRYLGSQNWPFPSQLMAGFRAEYLGGEVVVDHEELEDARWFRRDRLPLLPPRRSIARWIIDRALEEP